MRLKKHWLCSFLWELHSTPDDLLILNCNNQGVIALAKDNISDIFTKPLAKAKFQELAELLGLHTHTKCKNSFYFSLTQGEVLKLYVTYT